MIDSELVPFLVNCLIKQNFYEVGNGEICIFNDNGEIVFEGYPSDHPVLEEYWGYVSKLDEFSFLPKEG